jgi:tRNA nucleotidyltransferase/poly(A) polymerase
MLANAQAALDKANQDLALAPDNIEFIKARIDAENELIAVKAQVGGFTSEQLQNEMALERELFDLKISQTENELEVADIKAQAAIEAETNLLKQLENEELLNQQLYDSRLAALELQKGLYKEGTQAYQDMVGEINILNAERTAQEGEEGRKRKELEQQVQQAKLQMTGDAIGALNDLAQAFLGGNEENAEKAFNINKKLGIAQAVINTGQAITAALATANPIPGGRFIEAGIAAAAGAAQIMSISKQQFQSPDTTTPPPPSSSSVTQATSASRTPDFNVVGQSGTNAILESLQNKPMKAYVVGGEVTNQQQLDRKKVETSSFG